VCGQKGRCPTAVANPNAESASWAVPLDAAMRPADDFRTRPGERPPKDGARVSLERIVTLPLDGSVAFDGDALSPEAAPNDSDIADPDRIVALLPTGGTTGAPKVVPLSNRNVVSSAIGSMLAISARPGDRFFIALPLFHVGGAFCTSLAALGNGAALVIPTASGFRNPDVVSNFWRIVEAQRITHGALVPTGLAAAAAVPVDGADISRLRFFGTGASVCPPEIERRFLDAWSGECVRQIYGMTEFAGAITQTPHDREQHVGSGGIPVALAEIAVLANGEIHRGPSTPSGEILGRGPQMFSGYFDPRQAGATLYQGWLRSGDLGRIGADGEVYVTGRAKDVIIRGGHNIDPASIEDVALNFPGVGLAAAVGRPDPYAGETPILFVAPAAGQTIDEAALADHRAGVSEAPARPRTIVVIGDMPVTPVGKIFKPRLREIAAEYAARELLALVLPDVEIELQAGHGESGLVLRAKVPASAVEAARAELGKLPIGFDVAAQD
jgi:fatty-acyl-CoA synthase